MPPWTGVVKGDKIGSKKAVASMIFSSPTEYAIRAISELGSRAPQGCALDEIVAGTDLPREFLAKIFQKLVKGGVLRSSKGRGGGFVLARPPHETTLMDIVQALEGPGAFDRCVVGLQQCDDSMPCPQHDLYKPIRQRLNDYLKTTTVADLVASLRAKQAISATHGGEGSQVAVEKTMSADKERVT